MSHTPEHTHRVLPQTGWAGLQENWRYDAISGFLVFLIALPLCLGIAMASNFPPMSGIITAVVGGLLVSRISGSHVTINGPAAGLIVVILSAVQTLGNGDAMLGYRCTLAAILVASIFQIAMGLFKAGRLNTYFPASAVHGMLAAIGIIIMAKQSHVMLGVKPHSKEILETIAEIPHSIVEANPEIVIIALTGLAILIAWSMIKNRYLKMIPAPLIVVLAGMALEKYFDLEHEHVYLFLPDQAFLPHHEYTIGPKFLVSIPDDVLGSFYFPDFSLIDTARFWGAVLSIGLVGSLESLLSATAVDKLDVYKRHSDLNRDLTAVGIGNLVSSAIGGLPMIAEIVRSSANVNNGARTGWANFFHGLFLASFVVFFPQLIHEIPLASLAALLVYTGFRLASPKEFAKVFKIGKEQLVVFCITIFGVLATDLLIGVFIGILTELLIHILHGVDIRNLLKISYTIEEIDDEHYVIKVDGSAVFSNFLALKTEASRIPQGQSISFDLTNSYLIDHTVMEFIEHFQSDYRAHGGQCEIHGLDNHIPHSDHPLSARRRDRDILMDNGN